VGTAMATPERWDLDPEEFHKRALKWALEWRGIEDPCPHCGGSGVQTYGSTATWRRGIGGQALTQDVCDQCWGSGDAHRKGVDQRQMESALRRLAKLEAEKA
jgi:hypothetical protein